MGSRFVLFCDGSGTFEKVIYMGSRGVRFCDGGGRCVVAWYMWSQVRWFCDGGGTFVVVWYMGSHGFVIELVHLWCTTLQHGTVALALSNQRMFVLMWSCLV